MELTGLVISKGTRTGRVVYLNKPDEILGKLEKGDIVVCTDTSPDWALAFDLAGGFVTEVGSLLCHTAIIAREYGLPAITNVKIDAIMRRLLIAKNSVGTLVAEKGKPGILTVTFEEK